MAPNDHPGRPVRLADFDEAGLDAIFAGFDRGHVPGGAVGIAAAGRTLYRRGFGLANVELPVLLSPSIRLRIGSISKHFACLAFLLLCEEGRAAIDDTVGAWLPELHPVCHGVTMRQLMGHLGGLRDVFEISWEFNGVGCRVTSEQLLALYERLGDVNDPPGTSWRYNNGGYLILTAAIERIAGASLEQVLRERVFAPVGMDETRLRRFDTDLAPNSAALHTLVPGGFQRQSLGTALGGEGGVVSTIDDMLRWLAHMDAPWVGSAATWALIKTPLTLRNGTSTGYGLGLIHGRHRGAATLFHGGGVLGGNAQMLKVPVAGLDVIVICNRNDVSSMNLVGRVLDLCLEGLDPPPRPCATPPATGVFRSTQSDRLIQLVDDDGRQIVSIAGFDWPYERGADGALAPAPAWSHLRQSIEVRGDPVRPSAILFDDFGNREELLRQAPGGAADLASIAGRYRSRDTHAEAVIDASQLRMRGPFGAVAYELESLADGVWRARSGQEIPWDAILTFQAAGDGFLFSTGRLSGLAFRRLGPGE